MEASHNSYVELTQKLNQATLEHTEIANRKQDIHSSSTLRQHELSNFQDALQKVENKLI